MYLNVILLHVQSFKWAFPYWNFVCNSVLPNCIYMHCQSYPLTPHYLATPGDLQKLPKEQTYKGVAANS
jgi:hypothetical protein